MDKHDKIIFRKYGQLYEGTLHSSDGNRVRVVSLSGGVHTVDKTDVQTVDEYRAKQAAKEVVDIAG